MASPTGERLLPSLVDEIAQSDPHRVLYSVAKTKNPADGFHDIDARAFARAVNRCSWYIDENLGRGHAFPTLTYMGPQDVLYGILVLACVKTGYKLLLNSPRNTLDAHLSLLETMDCETFLTPASFPLPAVNQILAARPMRHVEIPGMYHWLDDGLKEKPYPYTKTYSEARLEPFVVLHTSGSTGLPKPITQTHGTISPLDAFATLLSQGKQSTYPSLCAGHRVYLTFPLFHCAGINMLLPASIYAGFTIVLGPFPPSADVANAVHVHGNVQQSCLPPIILVDLAKNPDHLENLGRLNQITFGGGPLPKAIGDLLTTKTKLYSGMGTTECGILPGHPCDPDDWAYLGLSSMLGYEYRHFSEDLYEQVIVRDPRLEKYQGIFATFPELTEWPMKDLYSKHPTKENLWLYRGRADDIIVFSTGEKLNPLEMESIICANSVVTAALIAGLGHFQSSLLVEAVKPPTNEEEKGELLESIWPSVQAANKESPSHGRIHRNMIAFTSPNKPMLRAGKGTVQRKMTLDLYTSELDALYQDSETPVDGVLPNTPAAQDSVQDAVKNILVTSTDIDVSTISDDVNLFEMGLDSLQVTVITREFNRLLSVHGRPQSLETRIVYSNPNIAALTSVVSALVEGKAPSQSTESDEQKTRKLYELHAANMPISGRQPQPMPVDGSIFLLTGSTGSLGSYILNCLHGDPRVRRVYCLNRGPESLGRQEKSQTAKGLQPLPDNVQCLDANLSKPYFGLSVQKYKELLDQVTHVIHNAWQVDFNLSIDSFASQVGIVRRFIDFSAHSRCGAQLFFVSSISTVSGRIGGSIAERIFKDWRTSEATGYGQSKFVSERLLDTAAREADISAVVCRVGQIAGPTSTSGMWSKQEWLPSLIASSKYLGKLPTSLGRMEMVDWIPVDVLGQSIVELAIRPPKTQRVGATVYHAVNPQQTSWAKLVRIVAQYLSREKAIGMVSLEAWVEELRKSASRIDDVTQNPAIKILGFFEGLAFKGADPILLSTDDTLGMSKTLASLGPVQDAWMENWMRQWAF
ncbi:hypothetical protein F4819DRAFT_475493 [Hypoxylon fuscum]|nr:hypothetical protein F4819DRAFT_475493 [Hypoxylon fuscum]